jgi:hypothetical protein
MTRYTNPQSSNPSCDLVPLSMLLQNFYVLLCAIGTHYLLRGDIFILSSFQRGTWLQQRREQIDSIHHLCYYRFSDAIRN